MAVFFGEVDAAVVPRVAIAAVAGLHRNERGAGSVGGGVLEEGAGARGGGLVFATVEEGGDGRDGARFANLTEERAAIANIVAECGSGRRVGTKRCWSILEQLGVEEG